VKKAARKKRKGQEESAIAEQKLLPMAALMFTLRRGLREFTAEVGMQALTALMEQERTELCGPRYKHVEGRQASRAGHAAGELVMGGRRVSVRRPRVRSVEGKEVELPSWAQFASEDPLTNRAVEEMVVGVSTRKYKRALEEVPSELKTRGTSKSAVSRRFVAATMSEMERWMQRSLEQLELASILIDGLAFRDHVILVALGVDRNGRKHVLGLHEGATENAAACSALLDNLVERGVRTDRSKLFVIDGSKALAKAIRDRFGDRALIQRCQVHKKRNVREHLPEYMRSSVSATMSQAYGTRDVTRATKLLENLARSLDTDHPGAAASLREGLAETLTVLRLGLPESFARTFSTTNAIENLNGTARRICRNVTRWRDGTMIVRWTCAAMQEAETNFRRVLGFKAGMPFLLNALQKNDARIEQKIDEKTGTG
jgi:transposase-like protein